MIVESGAFQDLGSNDFAGIEDGDWSFTVANVKAPLVSSKSPLHGASDVTLESDLKLTFNEAVSKGSGKIIVTPSSAGAALTVDVASSAVAIASNSIVSVTLATLTSGAEAQTYTVTIGSGAFQDNAGNAFAGFVGQEYQFTVVDKSVPVLVSQSPAAGATEVLASANVVLTFNEPVAAGTSGSVVFTPETAGDSALTVAAADLSVSGSVVTVNPSSDLTVGQTGQVYTVAVSSGAIVDLSLIHI